MIHWLVQSSTVHPALRRESAPEGLLSPAEQARYRALKTDKRRADWLLGRWTAKHLLQAMLEAAEGKLFPLDQLSVINNADGAPLALIEGHPPLSLSISHSHGQAFCAAIRHPAWPLGADMERIEPRSPAFVEDYFTQAELERVRRSEQLSVQARDTLVAAIWSGKEATLKALRLGLSVDTRAVACLIEPAAAPPQTWTPFAVQLELSRLPALPPSLMGWWRVWNDYVLALVSQDDSVYLQHDSS
jgi:4'-phosphopantetheinyl transferase